MDVRRVVTGHDRLGHSIIASDENRTNAVSSEADGIEILDLWQTGLSEGAPDDDGGQTPIVLEPPRGGTVFRLVRFLPGEVKTTKPPPWRANPDAPPTSHGQPTIDARMHRTATTDYIVVVDGEIWAVMERGDTCLRRGDVLIQRATVHGWHNRSSDPCTIAAVMIDADKGC